MTRRSEHGVALLVVLWACTLLAILVGGFASLARVETEQARYSLSLVRARYAAEAGVMRAIHDVYEGRKAGRIQGPEEGERWIGDGRAFPFSVGGTQVSVVVEDEAGKIDLNAADANVLTSLFVAGGAQRSQAQRIAKEVVTWRTTAATPDTEAIRRYSDAGRPYAPRQARFPSIEELQSVLGMDASLFARVEPALTLWSGLEKPVPYYAPSFVLAALPGMDADTARSYVVSRRHMPVGSEVMLPGGFSGGWAPGSSVITIDSTGRVSESIVVTLRVTVRFDQLEGALDPRRPLYTILRWRNMPPA